MAEPTPAYVAGLADELYQRYPDLLSAEKDLAVLRGRLALVTRFIHNPIIALDIRQGLARDLHLPEPTR